MPMDLVRIAALKGHGNDPREWARTFNADLEKMGERPFDEVWLTNWFEMICFTSFQVGFDAGRLDLSDEATVLREERRESRDATRADIEKRRLELVAES